MIAKLLQGGHPRGVGGVGKDQRPLGGRQGKTESGPAGQHGGSKKKRAVEKYCHGLMSLLHGAKRDDDDEAKKIRYTTWCDHWIFHYFKANSPAKYIRDFSFLQKRKQNENRRKNCL